MNKNTYIIPTSFIYTLLSGTKNMKLSVITIGLTAIASLSYGQTKDFIDRPFLETTVQEDTLVTPDRIFLSIRLAENDTKGKKSVEELETKMIEKLTSIGINLKKQLTLSDLSSNFRKYFLQKIDIVKEKSYELLVYDTKTAGQVTYEMEKIGISNVDLVRTEYSQIEALTLHLKAKAVRKAKKQAESMAQSIQQQIGKAIFISDLRTRVINRVRGITATKERGYASMPQEYRAAPIEFDKIRIESGVRVKFILKPN